MYWRMYWDISEWNRVSRSFSKGGTKTAVFVPQKKTALFLLTPLPSCLTSKDLVDNTRKAQETTKDESVGGLK
jgi:hypothetical protein